MKKLMWEIFADCNYNCKECYQKSFKNSAIFNSTDASKIIEASAKVNNFININNVKKIGLLGGELSLLKKEELVTIINNFHNAKIELYTNYFRDNDYYIYILKNVKNIILFLSFHENEKNNIYNYFKKVINLLEMIKKNNIKTKIGLELIIGKNNLKKFFFFLNFVNFLKKRYGNVFLALHQELKVNSENKIIRCFDYFNFYEEELKKIKDIKLLEKLKREREEYNNIIKKVKEKKYKCTSDNETYRLDISGKLKNFCGEGIIDNDFFGNKIYEKKIKITKNICKNYTCSEFIRY